MYMFPVVKNIFANYHEFIQVSFEDLMCAFEKND